MESSKERHPPAMADVSRRTVADGLGHPEGSGLKVRMVFEYRRGALAAIEVIGAAMREPVVVAPRLITRARTAPIH